MASEDDALDTKTADAQLASDIADNSLVDAEATSKAADSAADGAHNEDEEGEEDEVDDEAPAEAGAEAPSKAKKKRKPKKKKPKSTAVEGDQGTAVASAATTGQAPVAANDSEGQSMPAKDIQQLLQQLALSQPSSQKREGKDPSEYKFWNTQPVPKFQEPNLLQTTTGTDLKEGAILPDNICKASITPEPGKLLEGFEWCEVDLTNEEELREFYELLYNHYVEDTDGSFRFNYSTNFLRWALMPPGWKKDWHIGVRAKPQSSDTSKKGKLVASICGVPVSLRVRSNVLKATEINFLAIHRKLRSKRLAPVLIKEVTRRCYQHNIFQALYTAGTLLPTPISTCRYYHRSLDWPHLYKTGFSHLPPRMTEQQMARKYWLPSKPSTKGLRPMKREDILAVKDLLERYLERFHLRPEFPEEDVEHYLMSEASKDVVWSYVVEQDGKVTDFISYYLLESTVLKVNAKNDTIRAAYLYYYATETAFAGGQAALKARLDELVHDVLVLAKKDGFHVFNALTLLENPLFLKDQKFEPGDGKLNYYLFNWRTALLAGGVDEKNQLDQNKMGGVGVVML